MKAPVYTAPLEMQLLEVHDPVAAEGEVIVDSKLSEFADLNLRASHRKGPFRVPPLIMRHEFTGRRADDGSPVVVNPVVSCWHCDLCLHGRPNVCRRRSILGIQRPGAYAEKAAVPERNCYQLPAGTEIAIAAMTEALANAIHAVRLAQKHDPLLPRVGIIGAGTLGFLTALTASMHGAASVSIADLSAERRCLAPGTGADSISGQLDGEFDAIFDAVGTPATRRQALNHLSPAAQPYGSAFARQTQASTA
jgi:threonine dehydrogenase-like Zn-dependent dehydrogenase